MSFWRTYYHFVWTTRERHELITAEIETTLYPYLINKSISHETTVHAINGIADHIHIIASVPPKLAVAEYVKLLKGSSSHYLNQIVLSSDIKFEWQRGYGVFSLGQQQLDKAIQYVKNQKIHHAEKTTNAWLEKTDEDEMKQDGIRETPTPYFI